MCAWCQKEFNLDPMKMPKGVSHGYCRRHFVDALINDMNMSSEDAEKYADKNTGKDNYCLDMSTRPDLQQFYKKD